MTIEELKAKLLEVHDSEAPKQFGRVTILFTDGELCSTKSGDLFGQRNLNCIRPGVEGKELPFDLPASFAGYQCIFLGQNREDGIAETLSDAICELLK